MYYLIFKLYETRKIKNESLLTNLKGLYEHPYQKGKVLRHSNYIGQQKL